jgi:hypothetical protein
MTERTAIQCDISPEILRRFTELRKKLGMSNRALLERILIESMPRWELVTLPSDKQ